MRARSTRVFVSLVGESCSKEVTGYNFRGGVVYRAVEEPGMPCTIQTAPPSSKRQRRDRHNLRGPALLNSAAMVRRALILAAAATTILVVADWGGGDSVTWASRSQEAPRSLTALHERGARRHGRRPHRAGKYEWRLEHRGAFVAISITTTDGTQPPIGQPTSVHVGFGWDAFNNGPWLPILSWEANCNGMFAQFRAGEHRLRLSDFGGSAVLCPETTGREDDWLLEFFKADPYWQLHGPQLTLTSGANSIQLAETKR
jgi:heat shock protein HslJ